MMLLSGLDVRDVLKEKMKNAMDKTPIKPELVIFQVGNNPESGLYINQKKKFGENLGIPVRHVVFSQNVSEEELIKKIKYYNSENSVTGIIVQLPLPKNLDRRKILDSISPSKDVDGLGVTQSGLLYAGQKEAMAPATARGILELFDFYGIYLKGKGVVIIGRSDLVGKPTALLCMGRDATVTVCHSLTENLKSITKTADILIVACGKPKFVDASFVRDGQIVVDVGIHSGNRTEPNAGQDKIRTSLCGDVDFDSVKSIVSAITPVPGGVGPLTVASLFLNLIDAQRKIMW